MALRSFAKRQQLFGALAKKGLRFTGLECRNAGNAKFETLMLEARRPA